jgi:hypothetical protein
MSECLQRLGAYSVVVTFEANSKKPGCRPARTPNAREIICRGRISRIGNIERGAAGKRKG